jgi:hypothetical protein
MKGNKKIMKIKLIVKKITKVTKITRKGRLIVKMELGK